MSDKPDPSSQTQEPTPKKLKDARKKGDVPQSREGGNMMVILSLAAVVAYVLPSKITSFVQILASVIDLSGQFVVGTDEVGLKQVQNILSDFGSGLIAFVTPVTMVMLAGAILGIAMQGQTVIAADRLKPKLSKISPIKGLTRLFSKNTIVEFLKSIGKVLSVGTLAIWIWYGAVKQVWQSGAILPETLPNLVSATALKLLVSVAIFLVPVAIIDIVWQKFQWKKKQMMTYQEIKDEMKDSEGDPHLKGKRIATQRARAKKQLTQIIPTANVIVTNPTHFAVALKYEREVDVAPVCIAKGADLTALRIRRLGTEAGIPVIENKLLARGLFNSVDIDQYVPEEHWHAVAEIISYIDNLEKTGSHRAGPMNLNG